MVNRCGAVPSKLAAERSSKSRRSKFRKAPRFEPGALRLRGVPIY